MAYAKRYAGGFLDKPALTTPIDSAFLNAVETTLLKLQSVDPTADGQVMQWDAANTRFGPALLLNKNIAAGASIDKSKLNLAGTITDADIAAAAGITGSKLANVPPSKITGYPADATKALFGDGTWKDPTAGSSAKWAKAYRNTNFVLVNNSNTIPALDTFASNTIGATLDGAGRVVVASAGLYLVIGYVPWPPNTTGTREIVLVHAPGSTIFAQSDMTAPSGTFIGGQIATGLLAATAGDSIGLDIFQNSGGSLTIAAAGSVGMSITVVFLGA